MELLSVLNILHSILDWGVQNGRIAVRKWWKQEHSTVPIKIMKTRTQYSAHQNYENKNTVQCPSELWKQEHSTVPIKIMKTRTQYSAHQNYENKNTVQCPSELLAFRQGSCNRSLGVHAVTVHLKWCCICMIKFFHVYTYFILNMVPVMQPASLPDTLKCKCRRHFIPHIRLALWNWISSERYFNFSPLLILNASPPQRPMRYCF
jgi:hypothetical protein